MASISVDYSTGLQAYWEMEESSGIRYDATANDNDVTDVNTVGQGTGIQGNCADLELTNSEYFSIPAANTTGILNFTNYFTTSFWVKIEQLPSTVGGFMTIAYTYYSAAIKHGYFIGVENVADKLFFRFWGASADSYIEDASATFVSGDVGNWVHIGISVDVANVTGILYKNGSARTFTTARSSSTDTGTSTNAVTLGATTGGGSYLDGLLDEFGIWNTQLVAADFIDIYNSGAGIPYEAVETDNALSICNF